MSGDETPLGSRATFSLNEWVRGAICEDVLTLASVVEVGRASI